VTTVDTTGIDRANLLAALYNRAQPQGLGFLNYTPEPMSREEAERLIEENKREWPPNTGRFQAYFDYLKGRVIKTDVLQFQIDPWLFDRDNGEGALQAVVDRLRR
jgi:hypothetical protein